MKKPRTRRRRGGETPRARTEIPSPLDATLDRDIESQIPSPLDATLTENQITQPESTISFRDTPLSITDTNRAQKTIPMKMPPPNGPAPIFNGTLPSQIMDLREKDGKIRAREFKPRTLERSDNIDTSAGVTSYVVNNFDTEYDKTRKNVPNIDLGDDWGVYDDEFYGGKKKRRKKSRRQRKKSRKSRKSRR